MKSIITFFQKIINLGIDTETKAGNAVKIRMINVYTLIAISTTVLGYFALKAYEESPHVQFIFWGALITCSIYLTLNALKQIYWCRFFFITYHNFIFVYASFLIGDGSVIQFLLFLNLATGVLLFRPLSKGYYYSAGLTLVGFLFLEIFDYQLFIDNMIVSETKLRDVRIFVEAYTYIGLLTAITVFAQNLFQSESSNRKLLARSTANNDILARQQEKLRLSNQKLVEKQSELEEAHQELQKAQESQISELNYALSQQIDAIDKVTIVTHIGMDGKILDINTKHQELFHFTKENIIGKKWEKLIKQSESPTENLLEQVSEGKIVQLELCHLSKLNTTCWTNSTLIPFYQANGEIEKFVEISFSIDKLIKQQETLEESRESLEFYDKSLTKFSQIMRWDGDDSIEDWSHKLLDNLVDYLGAFQGAIYGLNSKTDTLKLLCAYAYDETQELKTELKLGEGVIGEVARSQKVIRIENEDQEVSILVAGKPMYIKSVFMMPLILNEKPIGVLVLTSLKNFSEKSIEFLHKISGNISASLSSISNSFYIEKLLGESNEKNQELQMREEELQQNLEQLGMTSEKMRQAETQLRANQKELKKVNENLEKRVKERTYELEKSQSNTEVLLKDAHVKNEKLQASEEELRQNGEELKTTNEHLEDIQAQLQNTLNEESKIRKNAEEANEKLKQTQTQLVQSEKMASLGQLVAGIAHEINNPVNFVYAGTDSLKTVLEDFAEIVDKYEEIEETVDNQTLFKEKWEELLDLKDELEFEDMRQDMFDLLADIRNGAERTAEIVKGLRTFSRLDENDIKSVNLHENLDSTLVILHNKYKNRIEIKKDYAEDLPEIDCFPGQINQVFMNILSNAMQAIPDTGKITIKTESFSKEEKIQIRISDTGAGMPPEIQAKIFEPFFTTKDVGEGTGMGLSISHSIIQKHTGTIEVESQPNKGTTFVITLPVQANIQPETN